MHNTVSQPQKRVHLIIWSLVFLMVLSLSCTTSGSITTIIPPTIWPKTPTPLLPSRTITVSSTDDEGAGTLRQAILSAQPGDIIIFDPVVFPKEAPAVIYLNSCLPSITEGNLTIDASNAGVILDGSNKSEDYCACIEIMSSSNTIRGLKIQHFLPGAGFVISGGSQFNVIGGDIERGQGNRVTFSGVGVGLWGANTSFNTVSGNLLGTDIAGSAGLGNNSGIYIAEGAKYNLVGPSNHIAFNNEYGVHVNNDFSIGNLVQGNSIHNNTWSGIELSEGGNIMLAAPLLYEFDLADGFVAGTACARCVVEIFSDSGDEGKTYEGKTTTDELGTFVFAKGSSFSDPSLTATATDLSGNTSKFSQPTDGASKSISIQAGNPYPRFLLQPENSINLEDNRIGDMYNLRFVDETPAQFVERASDFGFKWMRVSIDMFDWSEVVSGIGHYSTDYISPEQYDAITLLTQNGITVLYTIVFWDEELGIPEIGHARFASQEEIDRYLDYVQFLVENLKDRVQYWEIMNEPNFSTGSNSQQNIQAVNYIELVRQVVPVIRAEDPDAKIVVGAYALSEPTAQAEMLQLVGSDVMSIVDAISWHVGSRYTAAYPETREYYYAYPTLVRQLQEIAEAQGFQGEYIAAELAAWQHEDTECDPCYPWTHGFIEGAKYLARGLLKHLSMDLRTGTADHLEGDYRKQVIRNIATVMAGAEPTELTVEVKSEIEDLVYIAFTLSNGNLLFAIWSDGLAVDDHVMGKEATITFPNLSAQSVTGIDVLEGFEQELIWEIENKDLVVCDIFVNDYPIILRIAP